MAKKLFNIFKKFSVNAQDDDGRTRLYKAAKNGNVRDAKRLLLAGADPNIKTKRGLSPLHQAVYWGEVEIVKALLRHGADVNIDNGKGWTPLHSAAMSAGLPRRKKIIKMLLEAGADSNKADIYGWSPKDYMKLWIKHDRDNLKKLKHVMDDKNFLDDVQQPDITKLGLKKNKPEPPAHHIDDSNIDASSDNSNDNNNENSTTSKKSKKNSGPKL